MPNLWTKAIQSINEKIAGPRTNDIEIKMKYEEALLMDKALIKLKNIISNFSHCFEEIMNYNREISESIFVLYDNNEEYKDFANVLNKVHIDNNRLFKEITEDIHGLNEKIKDWPLYFSKVKFLFEEKERSRKEYDHYELKMEELSAEKELRVKKSQVGDSFIKKLERNLNKYKKAKEDYLDKCVKAYDTFENLLNDRFNLMNQPLLSLFYIEMKLYENFSSKYKTYKNLEDNLTKMRRNFASKDRKLKYDPSIFLKNPYLESKFNKLEQASFTKIPFKLQSEPEMPQKSKSENSEKSHEKDEELNKIMNAFLQIPVKNKVPDFIQEDNKENVARNSNNINHDINDFFDLFKADNKKENINLKNEDQRGGILIKTSNNPFKVAVQDEDIDTKSKISYPTLSVLNNNDILGRKESITHSIFQKAVDTSNYTSNDNRKLNIDELFKSTNKSEPGSIDNNPTNKKLFDPFAGFL